MQKDIVERLKIKAEARKAVCPSGVTVPTDAVGELMLEAAQMIEFLREQLNRTY